MIKLSILLVLSESLRIKNLTQMIQNPWKIPSKLTQFQLFHLFFNWFITWIIWIKFILWVKSCKKKNLNTCSSSDNFHTNVVDTSSTYCNLYTTEWYEHENINVIGIKGYSEPIFTNKELNVKVETFNILDEATLQHSNCETLFKLEDLYKFIM